MSEDNWQTCVIDPDYEINMRYPFEFRKKSTCKIIKESEYKGNTFIHLNLRHLSKIKVVMEQIASNNPIYKFMQEHNAPQEILKKYKNELYLQMINQIAETIED